MPLRPQHPATTLAGPALALMLMTGASAQDDSGRVHYEGETHLANVRQLTFGGQNAEAYFSSDGTELILQSTIHPQQCDAIYRMNVDGSKMRMVSSGEGVTTCSFIAPDGNAIIYSSTHLTGPNCPPKPDYSRGYVWALYDGYDVFRAGPEGENLERLTDTPRYDAEAVYSPQGDRIVFTSLRTGDLELFLMNPDGSGVEQLTFEPGYDGGAFFSRDGKWIVWRASRPQGQDLFDYRALLARDLIRPGNLEIYIMSLADRKPIQLTRNGAANFGPYWHPNGRQVIFSSNLANPQGRNFDLYLLDVQTRAIERVTHYPGFDGFPMFSYDGSKLVFASNRNGRERGETNIFIADWR